MKRVLLTGAGGFLGRATIRPLLDRGFEVHAVTSKALEEFGDEIVRHGVDLLDTEASSILVRSVEPTHLLHFAWYVEHGKFWEAPENLDWVTASEGLFESFSSAGGKRIVAAGTCAEYDWDSGIERFSEDTSPIKPRTLYGRSKHESHLSLERIAVRYGVSYSWGRIFFLFGPYESPTRFVPSVIRSILDGVEARCSSGEQLRDLMYIGDSANAFAALLDSEMTGAVNIGTGTASKLAEVAEDIGIMLNRPELVRLGALPTRPDEPVRLLADIGRLRQEVGFNYSNDLVTGLRKTIEWWQDLHENNYR